MKVKRLHVYLTLVFLCAGYMLAYSYNYSQEMDVSALKYHSFWEQEDQIREKIVSVNQENINLEQQLRELQMRVSEKEEEMAQFQDVNSSLHKDLESVRLLSGLLEAMGPGVVVTLEDSDYASDAQNPNDYIVHEQDVRRVVNELWAAGAEGISINGQRLIHSSSIRCVGPTIIVNDVKSAAPFEITAIGDPSTLSQALHLPGGVIQVLHTWGISVQVDMVDRLTIPAYVGEF